MNRALWSGIVVLCALAVTASAATLKVPSEYPQIQAAIQAAEDGDTVLVAPGVYYETINFGGKDIVVTSTDPNDPKIVGYTIIDADGDGTTVTFEGGETADAVLTGFTITGGFGTLDNTLQASFKVIWGAGIFCRRASPTIARNIIAYNLGPVDMAGGDVTQYMLCYGAGIGCIESDAVITHNIIKGNRAYVGGALLAYFGNTRVINNLIFDNTGYVGAGVVMVEGQLISNTIVANNTDAAGQVTPGGNVYAIYDPSLRECLIQNNIICDSTSGGGIYWEGFMPRPGAIAFNDVWNNFPANYSMISPEDPQQIVYDGQASLTGTAGNICADPLFVNALNRDYHLSLESPCINAGDPEIVVPPGRTDLDGQSRIHGARIDMGADEYVGYVKPVAHAGPDRHLVTPLLPVTLDGGQSYFYDPCGPTTFRWTQVSGPTATLDDPAAVKPSFTPPENGQYVFELVVGDERYDSEPDQVLVLIAANRAPVADAGADRACDVRGRTTLDGTGSFDPDGMDPLTYRWTQVDGPPADLQDAATATPSFMADAEGRRVFELVVNDGFDDSEPSRVQCVAVSVTTTTKTLDVAAGLPAGTYHPDISGVRMVFATGNQMTYDWQIACKDLITGKVETLPTNGTNTQPKIDGDLVVWSGGMSFINYFGPENASVFARNLATGGQQALRMRSETSSFGHPAVSGNKVVWLQHLGLDRSVPDRWYNMPYDICGADLSDFSQPVYFTVAANVGRRDPFPFRDLAGDFDDVVDLSGNLAVWEGEGDIYAADLSDLANIRVFTVCNHPARQRDPAVSGRLVVWTDERHDRGDIYGADLSDLENIRELTIVKAPGVQQQPTVDGPLVAYADGVLGSRIRLAGVTRNYGALSADLAEPGSGTMPALDGRTLLWLAGPYGPAQGTLVGFGYSAFDGRVQNRATGKRYDYIQHAISDANDGGEIVASPDRYEEKINFSGKAVTVRSMDPNDPAIAAATVIHSEGNTATFTEQEGAASILAGLTITGGNQGIYCYNASPTIRRCTITGSRQAGVRLLGASNPTMERCRIAASGTAGIEMSISGEGRVAKYSEPVLRNCIIEANGGQGLHGGKPRVTNCTIVENRGRGISSVSATVVNSIVYFNNRGAAGSEIEGTRTTVAYSDVQGGYPGAGNIDADPLFVALGRWTDPSHPTEPVIAPEGGAVWVPGDYHLKSRGWRWDTGQGAWVSDDVTSPCIDAGDPAFGLLDELPAAPGDATGTVTNVRINMGAYGGTAEASLAPVSQ